MNQQWFGPVHGQDSNEHHEFFPGGAEPIGQFEWPPELFMFSYENLQLEMASSEPQNPIYDFNINPILPMAPSISTTSTPTIFQTAELYAPVDINIDNVFENPDPAYLVPAIPIPVVPNDHGFEDFNHLPNTEASSPSSRTSISSHGNAHACPKCPVQRRNAKDLHRHVVETHEKPRPGEDKIGCIFLHASQRNGT
ncbi:hypothetical protein PG984_000143 [Apiospora sp. TS-2023a]